MYQPIYDPEKTYEDNYQHGPFGSLADDEDFYTEQEPKFTLFGTAINYPFGIPAGPIVNARFMDAAFKKGFDVNTYKTTRSGEFPCHPFPNVVAVDVPGDLHPNNNGAPLVVKEGFAEPLSITNSFGVPSRPVDVWVEDATQAVKTARPGQAMIMSVMGTVREGQTEHDFADDYATAVHAGLKTGAPMYEINLSCPNIGNEGLVCYNQASSVSVTRASKDVLGSKPLIIKIGYFADDATLRLFVKALAPYCDGIAAINTIQAEIVDGKGNHPLPGKNRERSGVCGASITWAGLEMTKRLAEIRKEEGLSYEIIGVGGVMHPGDFRKYRDAGADLVQSATGAMWNPYLAKEIKEAYPNG